MKFKFAYLSAIIFLSLIPAMSFAGEYVLLEGHKYEVCRDYAKNLNSFKSMPYAMVCEREINTKLADFKKPEWKELDIWDHREMILQLENRMWRRKNPKKPDDQEWLSRIKKDIEGKSISLSEAWFDIDNNGKIDHILMYEYGRCDPNNQSDFAGPTGRTIAIWDDKTNRLDATPQLNNFLFMHGHVDVFVYKGRTYLDWFGGKLNFQDGTLYVYDSINFNTGASELGGTICLYRYKDQTKEKGR